MPTIPIVLAPYAPASTALDVIGNEIVQVTEFTEQMTIKHEPTNPRTQINEIACQFGIEVDDLAGRIATNGAMLPRTSIVSLQINRADGSLQTADLLLSPIARGNLAMTLTDGPGDKDPGLKDKPNPNPSGVTDEVSKAIANSLSTLTKNAESDVTPISEIARMLGINAAELAQRLVDNTGLQK